MSKVLWNWQEKVDHIRKILQDNAVQCSPNTHTSSDLSELTPIENETDVNASLHSQSGDSKWSTTATSISECLLNVINYSDFENVMGETYLVMQPSSSDEMAIHEDLASDQATFGNTQFFEVQTDEESSNKEELELNTDTNSPTLVPVSFTENDINWVSLLEMTKTNISNLINDHITLIQQKATLADLQKEDRIERLKMDQAREKVKRLDCIRRIRIELLEKMDSLNKMLNELEEI